MEIKQTGRCEGMFELENEWASLLKAESEKEYFQKLQHFLKKEYEENTVYPHIEDIYNALHFTDYKDVKVVILGQDPYHGLNQAHGLSFSVNPGVKIPPSLKNIFIELQDDMGCTFPAHGCLTDWAKQGVLLLNTVLTVRAGEPASHKGKGWEQFTDRIIECLNEKQKPIVFLLWGKHAEIKKALIDDRKHVVFVSPHPSPFSARKGFFGSKPFSRTNEVLQKIGEKPIHWSL